MILSRGIVTLLSLLILAYIHIRHASLGGDESEAAAGKSRERENCF
jgi:hypothetical protein